MNRLTSLTRWLLGATCALACLSTSVRSMASAPSLDESRQQLVKQYLEALNSKDRAKLVAYVEANGVVGPPVETRADRSLALAEQGAPFKLIRFGADTPRSILALIEDKNGQRLTLTMNLAEGTPPKMAGVMITGPDDIDPKPPKDYSGWSTLQGLADSIRKDADSPGMGIATIRDGKPEVAVSGVRESGKPDAIKPDDAWSVGSIGKPICSTVIGRLIDMGKLRFDTTLKEALPDVPMLPEYEKVTLRQLMMHRSGLPTDTNFTGATVQKIVGDAKTPQEMRNAYARDLLNRAPLSPPDTKFAYSNGGYALLAIVAERTMGKPYEQVLRELVFEPLGLKHSYVGVDSFPKELPSGHVRGSNGLMPYNMRGPLEAMLVGAGGGIYMSVEDVARFGEAHLKGLRGEDGLLKAATVQKLHEGQDDGSGRVYACGWGMIPSPKTETRHWHNGSNGTFLADLAIYPKSNLVVAAIVNRGGISGKSPGLQAIDAIGERFAK